jgi:hypothetical protein
VAAASVVEDRCLVVAVVAGRFSAEVDLSSEAAGLCSAAVGLVAVAPLLVEAPRSCVHPDRSFVSRLSGNRLHNRRRRGLSLAADRDSSRDVGRA